MSVYPIRNILVPIDLSENSLNALHTAAGIAKQHKANVVILYVKDSAFNFLSDDQMIGTNNHQSENIVNAYANAIEYNYGIEPKVVIMEGSIAPAIIQESIHNSCDLIVIGRYGASGYRDGFVGSNTYTVIKYAPCPVLMMPREKISNGFKRVLFPIRLISGALIHYSIVRNFLMPESSYLNVLGLSYLKQQKDSKVIDDITAEIKEKIQADKVKLKSTWGDGNSIAEDVLHNSLQNSSDLLVITSALDVTNKPFFIGPNVQKIINHSKVPILSIRKVPVLLFS
jgi:nucleotide-binding universal stress UspA family protein